MKLLATIAVLTAAISGTALAEGMPIQGAFAVAYSGTPNTGGASYCDRTGTILPIAVEAHGNGSTSLGALSFFLQKGIGFDFTLQGCLTLTAPNGDTLTATYTGQESQPNTSNFSSATGMIVFTGGTGRFKGATGSAKFTATFANFYPASSFLSGTPAPLQGMAFYVVEGSVSFPDRD
jgi:hypothetical protein